MIDLNTLFEIYNKEFTTINNEKQTILEDFREKEVKLKKYDEALAELEKSKNSAKFDLFSNLSERFLHILLQFDPNDIDNNTNNVVGGLLYLEEIKRDLTEVSKKYTFLQNLWQRFLNRKEGIDTDAKFIKDITYELEKIEEDLNNTTIDEIPRLEEKIENTKTMIERSISMLEDMNQILERHFFIGKESKNLYFAIQDFIDHKYKSASLSEITDFTNKVRDDFKILYKTAKTSRMKVPVIKIQKDKGDKVYTYGFSIEDCLINPSDVKIDSPNYLNTGEFIYIDNFPISGIFEKSFLHNNLEVADDQFEAIKEFNKKAYKNFLLFSGLSFASVIMSIFGTISTLNAIALTALYPLLFMIMFSTAKKAIERKYKLPKMFHFYETNYYIIKEGTDSFAIQNVIPYIFLNYKEIFERNEKEEND